MMGGRLNRGMEEVRVKTLTKGLVDAIAYCHEKGIVHRDIKCENIMVTSHSSDENSANNEKCVLIDFGVCALASDAPKSQEEMRLYDSVGTPFYAAPELHLVC